MNCYSELTYSIYVDGELPSEEARGVEVHLASCGPCRNRVAALRTESQLLREVLIEAEAESANLPAWSPVPARGLWGTVAAILAALAGLRLALGALFNLEVPGFLGPSLDWLNPFQLNTQLNLFFRSVFYLLDEGASMLFLFITTVGALIVLLLVVFASLLLRRRGPQISTALLALSLVLAALLAVPPRAAAIEIRKATEKNPSITIPAGQTIHDTLIAAGDTVTVEGVIEGNLIVAARRLILRGSVQGDVFVGAQGVDLDGSVAGNVVAGAQWVHVRGKIGGSLHAWGQNVRLESPSIVQGDVLSFAGDTQMEGQVVRDAMVFAQNVELRGKIGRNLSAFADRVALVGAASLGGDLTAHVPRLSNVSVDSSATVAGKRDIRLVSSRRANRFQTSRFYFWQGVQLIAALLVGALLLGLFPNFYQTTSQAVGSWGRSLGLGFAALIAGPVAIILVGITLIGLPVALTGLFLYVAGLYLAKIFAGAFLGQALFRRVPATVADSLVALLAGLAIIFVVVQIPFAGALLHSAVLCLGLGAFCWRLYAGLRPA